MGLLRILTHAKPLMPTYIVPRVGAEGHEEVHTYSSLVGFSVMINCIIGTGVFSMPSAFNAAGAKLAATSICVFVLLALICVLYVLEVNARAEGVYAHEVDETPGLGDGESAG